MHLQGFDLNLLRVFDALMVEHNTVRAGERIGLSQPAVSHALSRLRGQLGDDLFIRAPGGLKPTSRALVLAGPVREALNALSQVVDPPAFDPLTAEREIALLTDDYVSAIFLPLIIKRLRAEAPGLDLRTIPTTERAFEMLDKGDADFALSSYGDVPDRFEQRHVHEDSYVFVAPKNHPLAKGKISLKRFADANHVLMSANGDPNSFVDEHLATLGLKRRIAVVVNKFSVIPPLLEGGDLVATVPLAIVNEWKPSSAFVIREAPVQGTRVFSALALVWHRQLATHPAQKWFAEFLTDLFEEQAERRTPQIS